MYDFYGIYASCRDAAWRCLTDFDVRTLPVKLKRAAERAGIRVVRDSKVHELRRGERGASIYLPSGEWVIVYDDTQSTEESRMVIAHEFGHILLGHEYKYRDSRFVCEGRKLKSEREADMFAVRILAPACVLHELSVTDAETISKLCCIPRRTAAERARRMMLLESRNAYYKSELERKVRDSFAEYIEAQRYQKK